MLLIIILLLIIIINLMNVYFRKEKIIENNTGYDMSNTIKDCIVEWDEEYGPCSTSCGGGTQELGYKVTQQPEDGYWNGKPTNAIKCPSTKIRPCNEQPCPVDCEGQWGEWSPCQKDDGTQAKCGGGKRSRIYSITKSAVSGYISGVLTPGTACTYNDGYIEVKDCNVEPCPVDCGGSWGDYGACNKGTGRQFRTYNVNTPPQDGFIYNTDEVAEPDPAVQCVAADDEIQSEKCKVDCEYTFVGDWSVDKENGTKTRDPSIIVSPKNNGTTCPLAEETTANIDCQGKWEDNGQCQDYWKKQKYTITQKNLNAGKTCPHKEGDVKTLRPGIHTCKAVNHERCNWGTVFGCASYKRWTTYTPNGL